MHTWAWGRRPVGDEQPLARGGVVFDPSGGGGGRRKFCQGRDRGGTKGKIFVLAAKIRRFLLVIEQNFKFLLVLEQNFIFLAAFVGQGGCVST